MMLESLLRQYAWNLSYAEALTDDVPTDLWARSGGKGLENHPAWTIGHPITGKTALAALTDQDLLFQQGHTRGVMPINFNLDKTGRVIKGQFLCIGENVATCENLLDQTVQVYNGGRYDRD